MRGTTHAVGGLAVGALLCIVACHVSNPAAVTGVCFAAVIGSLALDVDICTSKMGRKIKPLSALIQTLFGHRTLFHAPLLYAALAAIILHFLPQFAVYIAAFFSGVASHLFLDMLNPMGIPLFYPFSRRFHIASIKTGGPGELMCFCALSLFCVVSLGWGRFL